MKVTVDLTKEEVGGIKSYLKETDGSINHVTNEMVYSYIQGIVSAILYSPHEAVSEYINT